MKNKYYLSCVVMSLTLVVAPSNLVSALVLLLELNILVLAGTVLKRLKVWSFLYEYKTLLILTALIAIVSVYSLVIGVWDPGVQLQLGFLLYLNAASSFVISTVFSADDEDDDRQETIKKVLYFSAVCLAIFALREILGNGTITYPALRGAAECVVLENKLPAMTLFASIPGAMICATGVLGVLAIVERWKDIFRRAEGIDD